MSNCKINSLTSAERVGSGMLARMLQIERIPDGENLSSFATKLLH